MTRGEHELPWLGTRRFWAVFGTAFFLVLFLFFNRWYAVGRPDAMVPVISLTGPEQIVAGSTVRYAVLVRDRKGAPMPGADVRLGFWKGSFIEFARATSSESGDATLELKVPDDFKEHRYLFATAEAGVATATAHMDVRPVTPGQGSVFISTDKPLYQPGQTVHIRALTMTGETPLADRPSTLEIRTPEGTKVFRAEKPSSAFGVVSHDFALAEQVKLGSYSISFTTTTAEGASIYGSRNFEVKRYSLPKLKLALEEVDEIVSPNAPVKGVVRAKWIFGEPVTKGAVTVTLERGGVLSQTVKGQLDKEGAFRFEVFPSNASSIYSSSLLVRANLEVEGGIKADASKGVSILTANQITLEAFPESGILAPEVAQDVYVVVTHPKPATVRVYQNDYPSSSVQANERGIAVVRVHPPKNKTVDIGASAPGGGSGLIHLTPTLERLVVRPDKTQYDAGQAMKLSVLGAEQGDRVALRITKGNEPLVSGICTVAADGGCEATLAMPVRASGLVWIHAMSLPNPLRQQLRDVRSGKRLVIIRGGGRDLDLKITPDKQVYAPRETGNVEVAVTGAGGVATKAQLGVSVADEAVFALGDVRPDLEKKFFTTDKDLATAQRGGYWSPYSTPYSPKAGPHEATKVYDTSTSDDVRATVLAALSNMAEPGGFDDSSSSTVEQKASSTAKERQLKIGGWAILFVAFMTAILFAAFTAYGIVRYRAPLLLVDEEGDATSKETLVRETRGLMFDWLASVLGPPMFVFAALVFSELLFRGSSQPDSLLLGFWLSVALFAGIVVIRSVVRVRRLPHTVDAPLLRRALVFLPIATFLGHLVILLVLDDRGRKLEEIFRSRGDIMFLPLFVVAFAQLSFGFLSVLRQGFLRPLAKKTRVWLLLSRASFIGLPLTLVAFVALVVMHVKQSRREDWNDDHQMQTESDGDNKEGGTGTRAKGEEGSMGNPLSGGSNSRYAVAAPAASAADVVAKAPEEGKGAAGVARNKPVVVRDYFPETLLWAPEIITGDDGKTKVQVPFADSITTWRFGLRAVSKTGQLGSSTIPLVVKQDFFVEASLPPLLTQGDEIAVPVTVYGYTESAQDVTIDVEGDGIATVGPSNVSLRLGSNETRGTRFIVRADKAGDRKIRIKASSPARTDIVERKVKIVPNGLEMVRPLNGRLQGGATVRADFPAIAIDGGNDLYVKIYGGPLSQVAEGLDGVFTMPHGCFEQTSSVTYPSILVLEFLARSKAVSPEVEKKARGYIADGYQRLISFEVPGGGFSLFGGSPASTSLTAYGLMELSDMSRVATVDEGLLSRTRGWLYNQRTQTGGYKRSESDKSDNALATAYTTWALATFGTEKQAIDPRLAQLLDWIETTNLPGAEDPYGLALRANALLAGDRADKAKLLLDKLASLAKRDEGGVHWTSNESGVLYSYGSSLEVEVTGLAAHALARANRDADLRAGALDWLVARKSAYGTWSTTQATIAAMRALLDEAKPAPKGPQTITVTVDGEKVDTYDMAPKARDVHHHVDLRRFSGTGNHAVEIKATGEGDISYQLVSTHWLPWERPKPASLSLDVTYGANTVPVGGMTKVRAKLSWNGKEPATMPLVEIALPPAFEAEQSDLDAIVSSKIGVERWSLEHGKVTLYLASLAQEKPLDISFTVRATRAAKVVAPASTAYLYYRPEVRTETAPLLLRAQ